MPDARRCRAPASFASTTTSRRCSLYDPQAQGACWASTGKHVPSIVRPRTPAKGQETREKKKRKKKRERHRDRRRRTLLINHPASSPSFGEDTKGLDAEKVPCRSGANLMPRQPQNLHQIIQPCTDGILEEQLGLQLPNAQHRIIQQPLAFFLRSKWTGEPHRTSNHHRRLLRFSTLCELRRPPHQHRVRGFRQQ